MNAGALHRVWGARRSRYPSSASRFSTCETDDEFVGRRMDGCRGGGSVLGWNKLVSLSLSQVHPTADSPMKIGVAAYTIHVFWGSFALNGYKLLESH